MDLIECLALFLVAMFATALLVPLAKKIAVKFGSIDYPSERRVNKRPVPRMGGVAMLGGMVVSLVVVRVCVGFFGWEFPSIAHSPQSVNYWGVGVGVLLVFAVGAVDDVVGLKPKTKFLGQIVAACVVAASGLLLSNIQNPFGPGFVEFGWLAYPITVFYLVAFANVINLIDGLDGLAAGITAISSLTIFVFSALTGRFDAACMSLILAGVCVGFLWYNFYPASIFMGDSGSLLLGFSLGAVSLFAVARSALFVSLLVPLLAAGVPILDTAVAIGRRLRAHKPIDQADRGHIHHRLLQAGLSHRATVLVMWGCTAVLSLCAVLIAELHGVARIVIFLAIVALTAFAIFRLRLLGPVLLHHYNPRNKEGDGPKEGERSLDAPNDGDTD